MPVIIFSYVQCHVKEMNLHNNLNYRFRRYNSRDRLRLWILIYLPGKDDEMKVAIG